MQLAQLLSSLLVLLVFPVLPNRGSKLVERMDSTLLYGRFRQNPSTPSSKKSHFDFSVDAAKVIANVTGFWKSTGFCPPDPHQDDCHWFLSPSVVQDLALIGAVPHAGIQQVRVHWLLDSVKILRVEPNLIVYNFTCLDLFVDLLWQNELYPGFEVMGNPSNYFMDFEDKTQVVQWKDLVNELAMRYIGQYGVGYVSKWNFESWNEPRPKAFDSLNMTIRGFLNYYDATAEGLRRASPLLRLGGPGGACTDDFDLGTYCWALLDHAANGIDLFTGKKDVKLDFISIHKKGKPPLNNEVMVAQEVNFISLIRQHLPRLSGIPIYNDEADPQVSWDVDRWWQADVTYAAMATKAILFHQSWRTTTGVDYRLLSNDNAFLSYQPFPFTQRTLLARFQVNTTSPPHLQFIRKPIYSVMGMLSLLGDGQLLGTVSARRPSCENLMICDIELQNVSILATIHKPEFNDIQDSWQLGAVVYFSEDTSSVDVDKTVQANITFKNIPSDLNIRYVIYTLDNLYTNPFGFWKAAGSPPTPNWNIRERMRSLEEPIRMVGPVEWFQRDSMMEFTLKHPSVSVLHMCAKADRSPNQVTNVVVYNVTFNQVMIVWSDSCVHSKCIKTYEVEFSKVNREDLFHRINDRDTFFNSFVYVSSDKNMEVKSGSTAPGDKLIGFYRVRAVDYWNRPGPYSLVTPYQPSP